MLKAWNANKLGHGLAKAGLDTRALRRALAASEDALTSSVFGRVSYLPAAVQLRVWDAAAPLGGPATSLGARLPDAPPAWEFWPNYAPAKGDRGLRVEPDVVVRYGAHWLVVEAKHHGHQYAGQWRRELRAIRAAEEIPEGHLHFIAVGGNAPEWDAALAAEVVATPGLGDVALYRLTWSALHVRLAELRQGGGARGPDAPRDATGGPLDHGHHAMLADACEALAGAGHSHRPDVWTLPAAHARIGPSPFSIRSLPCPTR